MKVGMIGLGKLGLPVAVSLAYRGLDVIGWDTDPAKRSRENFTAVEAGPTGEPWAFLEYLGASALRFAGSLQELVDEMPHVIFVAVQTPHQPEFDGTVPLTDRRADFDYTHLVAAVGYVAPLVKRDATLAVISTCLPGTMRRLVEPLLEGTRCRLAYNPSFIAMGTVMRTFNPEFILIGQRDWLASRDLRELYSRVAPVAPILQMGIESAELAKVAYNTFIAQKIVFANAVMEICDRIEGADVDDVMCAIKHANRRLISTAYLTAGMGDGGGCHPRDNIAMSWLARDRDLSCDIFGAVMEAREAQADYLAGLMAFYGAGRTALYILGDNFKPGAWLREGSPALLVADLLRTEWERDVTVLSADEQPVEPGVYLIGVREEWFKQLRFPAGSVVIDPHRIINQQPGVEVVSVGEAARGAP